MKLLCNEIRLRRMWINLISHRVKRDISQFELANYFILRSNISFMTDRYSFGLFFLFLICLCKSYARCSLWLYYLLFCKHYDIMSSTNRNLKSSFKAETFYCIQNEQIMPSASSCSGRRPRRPLVCIDSFDFHGLPSRQPLQAEEEIITFLF